MSDTTATRIGRAGTLLVLAGFWLAAAAVLWRTRVPAHLPRAHVSVSDFFTPAELQRADGHVRVLRLAALGAFALQLGVLALLALRPPRLRASLTGGALGLALWLAAVPSAVVTQWWDRRYGIAVEGWGTWTLAFLPSALAWIVGGAIAGAAVVALARRTPRWWLGAAGIAAAAVAVYALVNPLLGGGVPLRHPPPGVAGVRVEVDRVHKETRAANAEAVGIGPTQRIVFWDTILRFPRRELAVIAAHERAHLDRRHIAKGLAWTLLFLVPGLWLVSRTGRPDRAELLPRAALAAAVVALVALPLANAVSRRYEREADWIAVERTRDAGAAANLFRDLAISNALQPDPPRWAYILFADHPSTRQRLELAKSFRAAESRGGPGSP
ncbi:MAG TPA: M48 family metalloprotease [Gaiellaceae bacterium]|jgi:STE24 endopeptidase